MAKAQSDVVEKKTAELGGQLCPMCQTKNLTLTESEAQVPFFGRLYLFAMTCSKCKYHKSDVESAEPKEPAQYALDITSAEDKDIRVVRSAEGTILLEGIGSIEPGPEANGWVTNVEGIVLRMRDQIVYAKNDTVDNKEIAKCQALLDKIDRALAGKEKLTLTITDPTGNSAIISDKAVKTAPKQGKKKA